MDDATPLPEHFARRFRGWRSTVYAEQRTGFLRLAAEGQHPAAMVISCCDSRVNAGAIFGAMPGEYFVHRNIANLVPPFEQGGGVHGTSAAVEYAVNALKVQHIIVLGHSRCGGIVGCDAMCRGGAEDLSREDSFVGRWLDLLRPGWERVSAAGGDLTALEHQAVLISLANLMTFPFVRMAVQEGRLGLHGSWIDIAEGTLMTYDPGRERFVAV